MQSVAWDQPPPAREVVEAWLDRLRPALVADGGNVELLSVERQVTPRAAPLVLVHSRRDRKVPYQNSELLYAALREPIDAFMAADGLSLSRYDTGAMIATIGPGAYTMLGGWLFALLGIVVAPKVKKPTTPAPPPPEDEEEDLPDVSGAAKPKLPTRRGPASPSGK